MQWSNKIYSCFPFSFLFDVDLRFFINDLLRLFNLMFFSTEKKLNSLMFFLPKKIWCFLFNILILNQISFFILLVIIYLFHFLGALCWHFGLYFHVEELESWFCSSAAFKIRIGRSAACRDRALRSSSFICYRLTDLILIIFIIFVDFLGSVGCNVLIWLYLIWFDSIWFNKIRCDSSHCNNLKHLSPINIRKFKIVPQDISKQTTA